MHYMLPDATGRVLVMMAATMHNMVPPSLSKIRELLRGFPVELEDV
jgi:hypothetical protein